jgi:hypothetical protein
MGRKTMTHNRRNITIASFVAAVFVLTLLAVQFGAAQEQVQTSPVVSPLKGIWTATLSGLTGCGDTTLTTTFKLDATGNGTQTSAVEHTAGCGDIDQWTAQVQSLNPDGSGFIAFGCGTGCGFGFYIQVSADKQTFNLGPQSVTGNFLAGVAIRKK